MDGSFDMRCKENRNRGFNMDGSLDMRFKENRIPGFNKDGSRDRRYKVNRFWFFFHKLLLWRIKLFL